MKRPKTKRCSECGKRKKTGEFYRYYGSEDWLFSKCKTCHRGNVEAHREKNIDAIRKYDRERALKPKRRKATARVVKRWRAANRARHRAHNKVAYALRIGKLVKPDRCNRCPSTGTLHAHHHDYSKPLEVEWLCAVDHKVADSERRERERAA